MLEPFPQSGVAFEQCQGVGHTLSIAVVPAQLREQQNLFGFW